MYPSQLSIIPKASLLMPLPEMYSYKASRWYGTPYTNRYTTKYISTDICITDKVLKNSAIIVTLLKN